MLKTRHRNNHFWYMASFTEHSFNAGLLKVLWQPGPKQPGKLLLSSTFTSDILFVFFSEVYLGPCQTYLMELFVKIITSLFSEKPSSLMFDRVLNMLLLIAHEKCPYSEFFWSVFSRIRTEYGEILRISPYSVRMRENTDQKNSENGHFSCSVYSPIYFMIIENRREIALWFFWHLKVLWDTQG